MSEGARVAVRLVLLLSLVFSRLVPTGPGHAASGPTSIPLAQDTSRTAEVGDPGPEVEPGFTVGPDLRSRLQDAEPAEAAQILRAYGRQKGIPLDARLPMPGRPDFSISLPVGRFTPEAGVEEGLVARALAAPDAEVALLLQLNRHPSLEETIEMYELGLWGLADDVASHAHAILAPAASLPALSNKPYIRWLSEYRPEFKYVAHDPTARGNGRAFVYPIDSDRMHHRAALAALGVTVEGYDEQARLYQVRLDEAHLARVAALPWVRWIEREPDEELLQAGETFEPDDSRELVCAFDGSGTGGNVVVGVRDNGLYWNGTEHVDFAGRIAAGSDTSVNADHGTHVTGIILGGGTLDLAGAYDARGVAPGASVFFQNSAWTYPTAFAAFAANGVQLSNHSWGFGNNYGYDSDTRNIDDYVDDEDMIVVFAAGNGGPAANTILNPGTGKNVITVGAVRYLTDDALPGRVLGGVTDYSSRGPTLGNGRLKPELVAPGGQEPDDYGDLRHGIVSCNDDPNGTASGDEWPENDHYDRKSGTSMAAPHVAGALAQMLDYYSNTGLSAESAKARLIGGTIPLKTSSGSDARNAYANTAAGYGLLNTYHAAGMNCSASAQTLKWVVGQVDYANDHDEHTFNVPAGTDQLIAVVAYDDETSDNTGQLGDDVDLSLEDDLGSLYLYALPPGVTAEGTVEKMIVEAPRSGSWTALVDFGPGYLSSAQDYGLYVMAILEQPVLSLTASLPHANPYLPDEVFTMPVTAQNTGGWIAAGVTAQVDWATAGLPNTTRFVDSLVCDDASKSIGVGLEAPTTWGTYDFSLILDGLNRGMASVSQPFSIEVCDQVTWAILMQPANGASTCDATPTFEWSALTGAPSYRLQVDDDIAFGSPAVNVTTANYSYTPGTALPAGFYYWRLRGESVACQGHWSVVRSLTILATPAAPALYYPAGGGEICGSSPYFSWNGVSGATLYQIQVDNNSGFGSPEIDQTTANTGYTHGSLLSPGTYYWRVRADGTCGWGAWSSTWNFASTAVTPSPPGLVSPGNGEDTCDRTPTLVWSAVPGVESYHLQMDDDSDFSSPWADYGIYGTEYTPSSALALDGHYWRVQSYNSCGYGAWSETRRVDVVGVPPVPALVIPADDSDQCNTNLGFQWSSDWATSYRLRVDDNPNFGSPEIAVTTSAPHYEVGETLAPKTYYWRVAASNACGDSGWSGERSLDLMEMPIAPTLSGPIGAVECDTTPTFWWSLSTWGDKLFRIQVDDDPGFGSLAVNATTTDYSYAPDSPLAAPKIWYWQVNAQNACGAGAWSAYASFRIATTAPAAPALSAPAEGSDLCDMTPAFDWSSASWTDSYRIEVDDDPAFGSPEISQAVPDSTYTPGTALPAGAYHWRAQACNGCGCGAWSSAWDLAVLETPGAPSLIKPSDGSKTGDDTPWFEWSSGIADEYRLQVDNDAGFGSPEIDQTAINSWFTPVEPLVNGTYYWRAQASTASCTSGWSSVFQLTVDTTCPTPPIPSLSAPPHGTETCDPTPTFAWTEASGATFYQIQIDDEPDLGSPLIDTTVPSPSFTPDTPLPAHIYYWRVRACNGCGCDSWTVTRHVWVAFDPAAPSLVKPSNRSVTCDTTPYLDWSSVDAANWYELEVDNDPGFSAPEIDLTLDWSYHMVSAALAEDTYYWRARSCTDCGCGAWSVTWSMTIGPPGSAPALTSPADGSGICTATPSFSWSPVSGTEWYDLEVDADPSFPSPFIDAMTPTTGYLSLEPLPPGISYWRVQAANACGYGAWSSARSLTCLVVPSTPLLESPPDNSTTCDPKPRLSWADVSDASSYRIQIDDDSYFGSPEVDATMSTSLYDPGVDLASGTWYWRVQASNPCGDSAWSTPWRITVQAIAQAAFQWSPADGEETCHPRPAFTWSTVPWATSYYLQVDDHPSFPSPGIEISTPDTTYLPTSDLNPGAFYWRVMPANACGGTEWSPSHEFTITWLLNEAPSLWAPSLGAQVCEGSLRFYWSTVDRATVYQIQVDGNQDFGSPEIDDVTSDTGYLPASVIPPGQYYWHVRAINACGEGDWSSAQPFVVAAIPAPPSLSTPADGSETWDLTPHFSWLPRGETVVHQFQVASDPSFDSLLIDITLPGAEYTPGLDLPPGTYHWRVWAGNACGSGDWSPAWTLTCLSATRVYLPLVVRSELVK